jgi:hypothetical protein
MDQQTQLNGLDKLLATVFDSQTSLASLLETLGFDAAQRLSLRQRHLPAIAAGLIEIIRRRLTWEDKDLWFRILSRRLGLDGEPPASLEQTAQALNIDVPYATYAEGEAAQCAHAGRAQEESPASRRFRRAVRSRPGARIVKLERSQTARRRRPKRIDYDLPGQCRWCRTKLKPSRRIPAPEADKPPQRKDSERLRRVAAAITIAVYTVASHGTDQERICPRPPRRQLRIQPFNLQPLGSR